MGGAGEEADAGSGLNRRGPETVAGGVFHGCKSDSECVEFPKLRASSCSLDLFGDCGAGLVVGQSVQPEESKEDAMNERSWRSIRVGSLCLGIWEINFGLCALKALLSRDILGTCALFQTCETWSARVGEIRSGARSGSSLMACSEESEIERNLTEIVWGSGSDLLKGLGSSCKETLDCCWRMMTRSSYSLRSRESSSSNMRLSWRSRSFSSDMSVEAPWGMRMVLGDDNGDGNGDQAWSSPEFVGDADWLPGASDVFPDPY